MEIITVDKSKQRTMYFVESADGVTVDVQNNLPGARKSAGAGKFNHTYCRIYYCESNGKKRYVI